MRMYRSAHTEWASLRAAIRSGGLPLSGPAIERGPWWNKHVIIGVHHRDGPRFEMVADCPRHNRAEYVCPSTGPCAEATDCDP